MQLLFYYGYTNFNITGHSLHWIGFYIVSYIVISFYLFCVAYADIALQPKLNF